MFRRTIETFFGSTRWFFFIAAVGVVAGAYLVWIGPQPCDDAYITFRHAKNLAAHLAPSWNLERRFPKRSERSRIFFKRSR